MKKLKRNWLVFYGKVLSAVVALWGLVSCKIFRKPVVCMYAAPNPNYEKYPTDTVERKPIDGEIRLMYGAPAVRYQQPIEKDGVEFETKVK